MFVDVADPGSERLAIVAALVSAGFDVRAIEIRDVPETRADLVVLAGDARDALEALRTLRDDGARPDVPVVLVGTPEGTDPITSGPGFGAERVLARPVDEEQLIEAVRALVRPRSSDVSVLPRLPELTLELAQRDRTSTWRTDDEGDGGERDDPSGVSAIHPMNEHVDEDPDSGAGERRRVPSTPPPSPSRATPARRPSVPPPPTGVSAVERRDRASEMPPALSTPGFSALPGTGPGTGSDIVATAPISDQLRALLSAADRRVFPSLAPIDVSIPLGDASARDLVPDEFLDDAPMMEPEPEEETLFLPVMPPSGWASAAGFPSGSPSAPPPPPSPEEEEMPSEEPVKKTAPGTPNTLSQRPARPPRTLLTGSGAGERSVSVSRRGELPATLPEAPALGVAMPDGSRRLVLAPGVALEALLALTLHRATARVEAWPLRGSEASVVIGFVRGEIGSVEGALHHEALSLARASRGGESHATPVSSIGVRASEDDAARDRIASLVERREMSLAARSFWMAAAERSLVAQVVGLGEGELRLLPTTDRDAAPRLGRTGPLLLELARALDETFLASRVGARAMLAPSRSFAAVCEALEPPRAVVALFEEATDGVSPMDLARASRVEPGVLGVAAALYAAGGLSSLAREGDASRDARAAEQLVTEHARRAEDADYFTLLGIARDASTDAIRIAREGRVAMLTALPLDALGLGALSPMRRLAIEAVEEAAEALAVPRLRTAYAAALARA